MICTSSKPGARPRRTNGAGAGLFAASLFLVVGCRLAAGAARPAAPIPAPAGPVVYTGADQVRSFASGPDGSLWAATAGGVLRWGGSGITATPPRRWTTGDGLASNDIRALLPVAGGGGALVATATGISRIGTGGAVTTRAAPAGTEVRSLLAGGGAGDGEDTTTVATDRGFFRQVSDGGWRPRIAGPAAKDADVWRTTSAPSGTGWAVTGRSLLRLADNQRFPLPPASDDKNAPRAGTVTAFAAGDRGDVWLATTLGLWRFQQGRWQEIALPPNSPASHVGALLPGNGQVVAGLYGDGLYRLAGTGAKRWERLAGATPEPCRFVTALAALPGGRLAVGTAFDGVWDFEPGRAAWNRRAIPHALPSADIYGLAAFDGALWAATFDRGLLRVEPGSGTVTPVTRTAGGLSADWTRGLVVFRNALLVRHATGQVDRLDAGTGGWRPAFAKGDLPRPQVFAMAPDRGGARLLIGGWAGWAATDGGGAWEHHWKDAGLEGQVVTAIAASEDGAVWIGTQKKGLLRYKEGAYRHFHEAHGLTDDWITCIAASPDGRLLVGTYTGGLLEWEPAGGGRFRRVLDPRGFAIRAIGLLPGTRRALAATPLGVYEETDGGAWRLLDPKASGGLEAQAVLAVPQGLWVGTRAGLAFVPGT